MNPFLNKFIVFILVFAISITLVSVLNIKDEIFSIVGVETDKDKLVKLEASVEALKYKNLMLEKELKRIKYYNTLLNKQLYEEKIYNKKLNDSLYNLKKKYSDVKYNNNHNVKSIIKEIEVTNRCKLTDDLKSKIVKELSKKFYFINKHNYRKIGKDNIDLLNKSIRDSYETQ